MDARSPGARVPRGSVGCWSLPISRACRPNGSGQLCSDSLVAGLDAAAHRDAVLRGRGLLGRDHVQAACCGSARFTVGLGAMLRFAELTPSTARVLPVHGSDTEKRLSNSPLARSACRVAGALRSDRDRVRTTGRGRRVSSRGRQRPSVMPRAIAAFREIAGSRSAAAASAHGRADARLVVERAGRPTSPWPGRY